MAFDTSVLGRIPLGHLGEDLKPRNALPGVVAGLVIGPVMVTLTISFSALIFAGDLSRFLPAGIGIALFSSALVSLLVALLSSFPSFIAYPNDRTAPILALMAGSIAATMQQAAPATVFATVVATMTVAALATGAFLTLLGVFRLGVFIRFIPYPVFGGFLAGTGLLLVKGSLRVMTGATPSLDTAGIFFRTDAVAHWLPGLVFASLVLFVSRRWRHFLILPGMLLGAIAVFYAVLAVLGVPPDAARGHGWLLGPFPASEPWRPLILSAVTGAEWHAVPSQAGGMATILFVSAVSVLLNASAMELAAGQDIDLNRELKASGAASLASGAFGGMPGFTVLSLTGLVLKMGVRSRLAGIVTAATCAVFLVAGTAPLTYFPKPVLGGILMFLGFSFLAEWVYDTWFRLTRVDYAVVILILAVVALFGYLPGVGVGVIACVVLFVVNYSRLSVVRHALGGGQHRSNVDRPREERHRLRREGDATLILKLQGYLFFGTANQVLESVRGRAADGSKVLPPLKFAVLDFRAVSGIDTSSVISFIKMRQLAARSKFTLVFTHLSPAIARLLEAEKFGGDEEGVYRSFADLDHGLEWCEDRLLHPDGCAPACGASKPLPALLAEVLPPGVDPTQILSYFSRVEAAEGETIIEQGAAPDGLYYLESGRLSVKLRTKAGETVRLRSMNAGTVVGEVGFYLGHPRSATVVSKVPSVLHRLSGESLAKMEREAPEAAAAFHRFIAHLLAERLYLADRTVADLTE